jgi:hypothetical protein
MPDLTRHHSVASRAERETTRSNIETLLRRYRDAHPSTLLDKIMAAIPVITRATPQPPIAAEAGERKLRPCSTVCKGSLIVADTASTDAPSSFRIECEYCGAIGSEAPTEAEAVNAWNQRGDSYMTLAEEIIRGLTECGNRMSVGDQVRLAHRLATLTPPERTAGEGALGGQPAEKAPVAVSVLAGRFDNDGGEWIFGVVNTPLTYPFTHWWPLPDMAASLRARAEGGVDE